MTRATARWFASTLGAIAVIAGPAHALTPATPIPSTGPEPTVAPYSGKPATKEPVEVLPAWQNPFMSPNPTNSVHNDSWQSDAYTQFGGPRGKSPQVFSTEIGRTCITLTFDSEGRLIGSCTNLGDGPALYLLDPVTLDTLAFLQLPFNPPPAGTNPALNTTGGAYFYLDDRDRVVVAASNSHILVVRVNESGPEPAFEQVAEYDPDACLPEGERMPSVLPDAKGRLWFVGRYHGAVGVLDPATGRCGSKVLQEEIENSFAIGADGTYVVSDTAMYKFKAGNSLNPRVIWRSVYDNSQISKPGQINAGSGTTPTLIAPPGEAAAKKAPLKPKFVAVTDNADPMQVVVYRAASKLGGSEKRKVCEVPVFQSGASATENSLISMGRSLVVENNYGYDLLRFNDILAGGQLIGGDPALVSEPGIARVEINKRGTRCRRVWTNTSVRAASVVAKGDAVNGLIYTYENVYDAGAPTSDPWFWTALDFDTGKVVFKQLAGHGGLYNNHYAGIALGRNPSGGKPTLYVGGVGGVMALRDGG